MQHKRFALLDGLRGVAALVVLAFHLVQQTSLTALPYAGLAVDFFYVLSGFVVAFAYEGRLSDGRMSLAAFMEVRAKRLYPLVFIGTIGGLSLALLAAITSHAVSIAHVLAAGTLALLLLPSFVFAQWPTAYPLNMASWSLTFEVFSNFVYGLIVRRLTNNVLMTVVALSAASLWWLALRQHGIAGGNNQQGWSFGFIRVLYPFFVGVLVYRLRPKVLNSTLASVAVIVVLAGLLLSGWSSYTPVSFLYVLLAFPIIVYVGAALEPQDDVSVWFGWLGSLSYPIYILQGPVLRVGQELIKRVHIVQEHMIMFRIAEGIAIVTVAWGALHYFDEPVQKLFRRRSQMASPAAIVGESGNGVLPQR